jgi:hypothetical protein
MNTVFLSTFLFGTKTKISIWVNGNQRYYISMRRFTSGFTTNHGDGDDESLQIRVKDLHVIIAVLSREPPINITL